MFRGGEWSVAGRGKDGEVDESEAGKGEQPGTELSELRWQGRSALSYGVPPHRG
ncbi:hypothetical protein BH10PLA2_BH10PLA2_05800 [soil metagenome]